MGYSCEAANRHTIIPATTRVVHIRQQETRVLTDMVLDLTHTVASAGAVVIFLGAILTNL